MVSSVNHASDVLPSTTQLQNGNFQIQDVIGQGGFGITYCAEDTRLHRQVAIKEFFPHASLRRGTEVQPGSAMPLTNYDAAKLKFLEEARVLASFSHRGIVDVLTIFEENNTAYMVMKYLRGKTLRHLLEAHGHLTGSYGA